MPTQCEISQQQFIISKGRSNKTSHATMAANGSLSNEGRVGLQYLSYQCQEVISSNSGAVFSFLVNSGTLHHTFLSAVPSATVLVLSYILAFSPPWAIVPFQSLLLYFSPFVFFLQCLNWVPIQIPIPTQYLSHIFFAYSPSHFFSPCVVRSKVPQKEANCLLLHVC